MKHAPREGIGWFVLKLIVLAALVIFIEVDGVFMYLVATSGDLNTLNMKITGCAVGLVLALVDCLIIVWIIRPYINS